MRQTRITLIARRLGAAPFAAARLTRLSGRERTRLLEALPLVLFVRLALWSTTMSRVHALLTAGAPGSRRLDPDGVDDLSLAVSRVSRLVPGATCLTQALALQRLLRRRGLASRVEVGFLRSEGRDVKGHAWLVCDERVVIGGRSAAEFTRTLTLEG